MKQYHMQKYMKWQRRPQTEKNAKSEILSLQSVSWAGLGKAGLSWAVLGSAGLGRGATTGRGEDDTTALKAK